jgi:hypothetical protein
MDQVADAVGKEKWGTELFKDTLNGSKPVLRYLRLECLAEQQVGSHVVAGPPKVLSCQAIVKSSKLTNRRSSQRLSQCVAP